MEFMRVKHKSLASLTADIAQQVEYELLNHLFIPNKTAAILQLLAASVLVYILSPTIAANIIGGWLIALILANILWLVLFINYHRAKPDEKGNREWLKYFLIVLGLLSAVWGSTGILFMSLGFTSFQFYLIAFFLIPISGAIAKQSATDFFACVVAITLILGPITAYCFYDAIMHATHYGLAKASFMLVYAIYLLDISVQHYQITIEKIVLNKSLEQKIEERTAQLESRILDFKFQATHDNLTRLPNRSTLENNLNKAIADTDGKLRKRIPALIYLKLDRFKLVNKNLGHDTGDQILIQLAKRLTYLLDYFNSNSKNAQYNIAARLWGNNFAIVLYLPTKKQLEQAVQKIVSILAIPFGIQYQATHLSQESYHTNGLRLTSSIGISRYPQDGDNAHILLMAAEAAMLQAKELGGSKYIYYTVEFNSKEKLILENDLHSALMNQELSLVYQPLVEIKSGHIVGVETLLRWKHPTRGNISPADIISLAEETGLIIPIGEWVLYKACEQVKAWHELGFSKVFLAVNLSFRQFADEKIVDNIARIIHETGFDPAHLELELTESLTMRDTESALMTMHRLKEIGLRLIMDDFGTGYSNLSYLNKLPLDGLKVDKSFVHNLTNWPIVQSIILMAQSFGLQTLAEGIETPEQLAFIKSHGCNMLQGYIFSPPVDAEALEQLLQQNKAKPFL